MRVQKFDTLGLWLTMRIYRPHPCYKFYLVSIINLNIEASLEPTRSRPLQWLLLKTLQFGMIYDLKVNLNSFKRGLSAFIYFFYVSFERKDVKVCVIDHLIGSVTNSNDICNCHFFIEPQLKFHVSLKILIWLDITTIILNFLGTKAHLPLVVLFLLL